MLNLIKNPNITSSHLFRADIFYDSENDHSLNGSLASLATHLKAEYRPLEYTIPGYNLARTIVRQMVPRNPQLDNPLVQTCLFFSKKSAEQEETIIIYLPHVQDPNDLPFYHPTVSRLAFTHTVPNTTNPTISLSYALLPSHPLTPKHSRTALRLLQTIHKHGQGQLRGYEKRVHLDRIIPQQRYQDTYARLKAKYGRQLSEQWVEVTDPGKHVFEDVGIAAWLIEVWGEMFARPNGDGGGEEEAKMKFPGFVDIGCGNGVLTYILLSEGYQGWGFDARERKTWSIFPPDIQKQLQRRLLVPSIFQPDERAPKTETKEDLWHDGLFNPSTFIISNHADELTAWTPLLAYLNGSAFMAVPCCSHDLVGSRFRAPVSTKSSNTPPARLPQQQQANAGNKESAKPSQAAETGSLARTPAQKKMPSAYSTLCAYVERLAEEVAFEAERDVLRIPSTRNQCIVGRRRKRGGLEMKMGVEKRLEVVKGIVERELGKGVEVVGREWIERAEKLSRKPGSGH